MSRSVSPSSSSGDSAGTTITSRSVDANPAPPPTPLPSDALPTSFPAKMNDIPPLSRPPMHLRKVGPLDPAHAHDWAALDLGMPHVSKTTVHISDMDVHVWGMEEIGGSKLPIGIIIVAHGFANKARDMEAMACGLIGEINRLHKLGTRRKTRDVLVATLDQRNHGERRRIRDKKLFQDNPARLLSSAANISGGVMDHQYLMKLLPSFLFPLGDRDVVEFMSTGFSMGGHVTWRLLREDPRIRIGVPICSLPSEALGWHFVRRAEVEAETETWLPPDLRQWFSTPSAPGTYRGKKILSLHGGLDALNPPASGKLKFDEIVAEARPGEVDQWVHEERGHVVSPEMVSRAAEWFWRWGFSQTA